MNPERSDSSETPRSGIARFLRGGVTDRFLGGAGFSAAAMPIAGEGNIGNIVRHITDTIPNPADAISPFTTTMPDMTTTIPERIAHVTVTMPDFGRALSGEITAFLEVSPTITPRFG